ncbi:hypothetical protein LCGC14_1249170 [marine sediment metagenome]|uniref:Uncharacterized protein n=1 Tax=marine sediment metagenome TaxID=412755 RepID=A0A0F9L3G0_9ZZZZ
MSDKLKQIAVAPTVKQLEEGPVVILSCPGWSNGSGWIPHGFRYMIRFDNGEVPVLKSHFDEWIGEEMAATLNIEVNPPKPRKVVVATCPVCKATGDEPCVTATGNKAKSRHKSR